MVNNAPMIPNLSTQLHGPLQFLEQKCFDHENEIENWFQQQWQRSRAPFYGSIDCRNAGFKIAPIDTNIFPAGWNNLNNELLPLCAQAAKTTLNQLLPNAKQLLLIPEDHSRNLAYFSNLERLSHILTLAGYQVNIGSINPDVKTTQTLTTSEGSQVLLQPITRRDHKLYTNGAAADAIILNNDLSAGLPAILAEINQPILPVPAFGWSQRLKSEHFGFYQEVATEFAALIDIDSWLINPLFDQCPAVNFMEREGQECIQTRAALLWQRIQQKYDQYNIKQPPFLVIKADQGTYGMAVMMIRSLSELESLNRKQRTRMARSKGGQSVTKAIIQEGVYSFETMATGAVAEPVVYLFGEHVVGGFYRVHDNKGSDENLNAPGMNFTPLAFAKSEQYPGSSEPTNRFYVYSVIARLAMLAAGRELQSFTGT